MMKKSILFTLENDLLISFNLSIVTSFAIVVFQLITFHLNSLSDVDYTQTSNIKISDMFAALDSTDILIPENLPTLIESIPADVEMKYIFSFWKLLSDLMSKLERI